MDHSSIKAITAAIPADRQGARRHYGVHPYFTRRPFNVVRDYIQRYSSPGDTVLDPFGGSGVTAIEAYLEGREAIHNDINPLASFIAQGIADLGQGTCRDLKVALTELRDRCKSRIESVHRENPRSVDDSFKALLPENIKLPSTSDAEFYFDLFTPRQLICLGLIREGIDHLADTAPRNALLLAWSATLAKLNKTFLSADGRAASRGGSSIFSIYRYKIAKNPVELPPWQTFEERALNVISAKEEIDKILQFQIAKGGWRGSFSVHQVDIAQLASTLRNRVDYIFTDPPYGGHISYLDLSVLWNNWLGQMPEREACEKELIVGGERDLSEAQYTKGLEDSIRACLRMLKKGRWFSVVFQHWNISYFEAILRAATEHGAELKGAVSQVGDPIWSMHKKKSNQSVLAGEMILTFFNSEAARIRRDPSFKVADALHKILTQTSAEYIYGEQIFNELVISAWRAGGIDSLKLTRDEFLFLLKEEGWSYDQRKHYWTKTAGPAVSLFA
jgi:DNA modification methylase